VAIRVGINGFGRIGRNFFRAHLQRGGDFEVVAANDLGDAETMAYLLKHDSVLGTLNEDVHAGEGKIAVGDRDIQLLSERDPANLPWSDLGVDEALRAKLGAAASPRAEAFSTDVAAAAMGSIYDGLVRTRGLRR